MAVATLTRGSTSIDIPLIGEGGDQLVSVTYGKPELDVRESGGTLNPRVNDAWSGIQSFTLQGELFDYATTHQLADLIKSAQTTPLELELPTSQYPDVMTVTPAAGQDSALTLTYPAGQRNMVEVGLTLTRVGEVVGSGTQQATTPTATGSGPVEIRIEGTTITIPTAGLSLERTVGRPNDAVRRKPQVADPRYEVKPKVTSDVFTFAFEAVDNPAGILNSITDAIFRANLGRSGVIVDCNGLVGFGEFEAVPVGSGPYREVHQAGQRWTSVPILELRRIYEGA